MADVAVVGLGRLGLPLAALLSASGLEVIGIDIDLDVVRAVNARRVPERIFEPGLQEMLRRAETLVVTAEIAEAIDAPISIILLPTPSTEDGSFSLEPILNVCRGLGAALRERPDRHVVVVSSTVSPGSCSGPIAETLEEASGRKLGAGLGLCYSPETVALGNVLVGFLEPDFIVIGESDFDAGWEVAELYRQLCGFPSIRHMSLVNAEIVKMALNCYVAMKITFANELAELCEKFCGADADVVTHALGLDSRISGKCLKGATAYGGLCFPRDTGALTHTAESVGMRSLLMGAVTAANRWQMRRLILLIENCVGLFGVKTVGVLGLAFKPDTNVTMGSVGMFLVDMLGKDKTLAYDPLVAIGQSLQSAQECVDRSGVIVITTPHPEFADIHARRKQIVIDCWRVLDKDKVEAAGAEYVGIGMGEGNVK